MRVCQIGVLIQAQQQVRDSAQHSKRARGAAVSSGCPREARGILAQWKSVAGPITCWDATVAQGLESGKEWAAQNGEMAENEPK